MSKACVVIADGFEEIEAITIIDVLRRGGVETHVLALEHRRVLGAHDIAVEADRLLADAASETWDLVVLPGGSKNAMALRDDARVKALLRAQHGQERRVAAICAAPIALEAAGVLERRAATCYPAFESHLKSASVRHQPVVVDGHVTTSRGPGTAMRFALTLVEQLEGRARADSLREQMLV